MENNYPKTKKKKEKKIFSGEVMLLATFLMFVIIKYIWVLITASAFNLLQHVLVELCEENAASH